MSRVLATLPIASAGDIVLARQGAHRVAEQLGLDRRAQTSLATAVSEIARNAFVHAGGGSVEMRIDMQAQPPFLSAVVRDQGPGIDDLDAVLGGQRSYLPGHGTGLLSARRLVDRFDIDSRPGATTVCLVACIPRAVAARLDSKALDAAARGVAAPSGDHGAALNQQNRDLIESLNELRERQAESLRLNAELEETNRGVVALYSELDQKADELRIASDMKSRFLSHMSHEFRTPLNSILALSRLLRDGVDGVLNAEQLRQVDYIRGAADELLGMVNDLLDLAKVEAGRLDVKPAEFTVESLFATLRGSLRPLLTNPAVELRFESPSGMPPLCTDEAKVSQILRNLVANALRFTERGHVIVAARHDAGRGRVLLSVEDTGIGIAADDLDRIFQEFSQIDGRLQRGGTGLGLPLSRKLAQLLGGDVSVRSTLHHGSTFDVDLPLCHSEPPTRSQASAGRPRALIVDDDEAFRYVLRHIAEAAGFDVLTAADGAEGLRMAREAPPALIVLDLQMPGCDGFDMLAQLRRDEDAGSAAVPVIVCTSLQLTQEQRRQVAAAYAIVPKQDLSRNGMASLMQAAGHPHALNQAETQTQPAATT